MQPHLNQLTAQAHIDDLQRDARRARTADEVHRTMPAAKRRSTHVPLAALRSTRMRLLPSSASTDFFPDTQQPQRGGSTCSCS
jgi:hypothetical protein